MTDLIRDATCEDVAAIASIHVQGWLSTYRGIMANAALGRITVDGRKEQWSRALCRADNPSNRFVFVATHGGDVVGFASGGPESSGDLEYDAELYAIYVDPRDQGRGVGQSLVEAVAGRHLAAGRRAMLIWVLAQNNHKLFYERLGGLADRWKTADFDGQSLDEIGYGWQDIRTLLRPSEPIAGQGATSPTLILRRGSSPNPSEG